MEFNKLKELCMKDNIPIIRNELESFFKEFILEKKIDSILEIGTAYGYSAYVFYKINSNLKITTIEKDLNKYNVAKSFLPNSINLVCDDAFEYTPKDNYDFIFIDGPKSKQQILVDKYSNFLSDDGYIIIDNIFLKDLKLKPSTPNREKIIQKNELFVKWLNEECKLNVKILNIGDGIAILWKK